jgi:hypothetical protein
VIVLRPNGTSNEYGRTSDASVTAPDMAAGVTDRLWEVSDLVALLEANEPGVEKVA